MRAREATLSTATTTVTSTFTPTASSGSQSSAQLGPAPVNVGAIAGGYGRWFCSDLDCDGCAARHILPQTAQKERKGRGLWSVSAKIDSFLPLTVSFPATSYSGINNPPPVSYPTQNTPYHPQPDNTYTSASYSGVIDNPAPVPYPTQTLQYHPQPDNTYPSAPIRERKVTANMYV